MLRWFLFIGGCTLFLQLEASDYYFKRISIEHGLSNATVNTMLRDYNGVLWAGTQQGLNRVGRGSIKKYFYPEDNRKTLQSRSIIKLFEGGDHSLWTMTSQGLYKYNPSRDAFEMQLNHPIHAAGEIKGGILFGGYSTFYFYDYKTRRVTRLPLNKKLVSADGDYLITYLQQINRTTILVGTESNGIYTYSIFSHLLKPLITKGEMVLNAVYWDKEQQKLYFSLYQKGLFCCNRQGHILNHYNTKNSALSNDIVLCIEKHLNKLWLGTDGGGISVFNPQNQQIKSFRHIPGVSHSLPINSIKTLYEDHYGNLWAGTVRDGLFQLKKTYIHTFVDAALGSVDGLSDRVVISLLKCADGGLWVGTDGGGLNYYNPATGIFTHHLDTFNDKIVSVTDFSSSSTLLVSIYGKGLVLYDTKKRAYRPFMIVNQRVNAEECHSGFVPTAYRIASGKLLILSRNAYIYYIKTHTFEKLNFAQGIKAQLSLQMMYVADNTILLSKNSCLYRIDENQRIRLLVDLRNNLQITSVCCDSADGKLWIATSGGLYTCSLSNSHKVKKIACNLFGPISSMQSDGIGHLWINSSKMLFSYYIKSGRCMIWDETEGFLPNDILTRDVTPKPSPYIYMGGINGLVQIDKRIVSKKQGSTSVYLQSVEYNGKVYPATTFPHEIQQDFNSLRIKINLKENDIFRHVLFRYRLRGEHQNSLIESYRTDFDIPSLAPGNYSVYVAYMAKDGSWANEKSLMSFSVVPPWYRQTWFVVMTLGFLLLITVLVVWWIIRYNQQRMKWKIALHQQALNEEKIEFLTNVSHELRTPLTLIYAPLKRLLSSQSSAEDVSYYRMQIERVLRQVGNMKNMVNQVLEFERNASLSHSLSLTLCDINDLVKEVTNDFSEEFTEKQVGIIFKLDKSLRPFEMDRAKIRVVLSNLLMNALKFSHKDTDVTVCTFLHENLVRVQVEDCGSGLIGVDKSRLFTRFYQGSNKKSGSGIGLAYCKELIVKHKGNIGAMNNPDGGTIMFFELNYRECAANEQANEYNAESATSTAQPAFMLDLSKYQILLVDDNQEFLKFLQAEMQPLFNRVLRAQDGEEALRLLGERQPDIVVSDVMMPVMDGYKLCRCIKEDIKISHIPVILLTAKCDAESQKNGYKLGADAYISKPFDIELLISVIETQLRGKELLKQKYQQNPLVISPQVGTTSNIDEQFMLKLNKLVKENYADEQFSIDQIKNALAMSRASLYNKMKEITGMGVNEYINKYRIAVACSLLENSNKPIADIAFETGFSSQRYFSTVFKAHIGCTPTTYRTHKHQS